MMRRRSVVGALGLWVACFGATAQPARKTYRIGVVVSRFKAADLSGPQTPSPGSQRVAGGPA